MSIQEVSVEINSFHILKNILERRDSFDFINNEVPQAILDVRALVAEIDPTNYLTAIGNSIHSNSAICELLKKIKTKMNFNLY
jgi:hypothetical protein